MKNSYNLHLAGLENCIGLFNICVIPIHWFRDLTPIPAYDFKTKELIGEYNLNKCDYCFN